MFIQINYSVVPYPRRGDLDSFEKICYLAISEIHRWEVYPLQPGWSILYLKDKYGRTGERERMILNESVESLRNRIEKILEKGLS